MARILFLSTLALFLATGCDDAPKGGASSASATAQAPAATAATPPAAASGSSDAPRPAPGGQNAELLIDPEGPYLAGTRIDLAAAGGKEKLERVIGGLQIDGKIVSINVEKKAKVPIVAEVLGALGKAGAPKVIIKTNGRGDLPKEVTFTPESRVSNPPACSVAAMVLKDLSTAIWPMKGGTGKRHRKGFAGPDLTHTQEALEKDLEHCESTVAFVSADDGVPWEDAFNIAGTVLKSDGKKRIDTLVLLREAPVAGRAITLAK
jgi:biopolymer transport protein ExbD